MEKRFCQWFLNKIRVQCFLNIVKFFFNQSLCFVNASDFEIIEQYIRTVSCVMTEYPFRLGFLAIKFILFFLKGDLFFHTLRKILFLHWFAYRFKGIEHKNVHQKHKNMHHKQYGIVSCITGKIFEIKIYNINELWCNKPPMSSVSALKIFIKQPKICTIRNAKNIECWRKI